MGLMLLAGQMLCAGAVAAAECHDVTGTWDFALHCVAVNADTGAPFSGPRSWTGEITYQDGCVFHGVISGFDWVGALHGGDNRSVSSDFASAKATGELGRRGGAKRHGQFQEMTLTYTFSGDTGVAGGPQTACTGVGTRR
jgi:hypothetical protein